MISIKTFLVLSKLKKSDTSMSKRSYWDHATKTSVHVPGFKISSCFEHPQENIYCSEQLGNYLLSNGFVGGIPNGITQKGRDLLSATEKVLNTP